MADEIWTGWADEAPTLPESREFFRMWITPRFILDQGKDLQTVVDLAKVEDVGDQIRRSRALGQRVDEIRRVRVAVIVERFSEEFFLTPPESELHVQRADGMDLCEYDDEDWPCTYVRERGSARARGGDH